MLEPMPLPRHAAAVSFSRLLCSLALFLSLAPTALPTTAHAQVGFVVHGEAGGAAMLSNHQRQALGFDNGATAMVRPGLRIADFFDIELGVGALWFPTPNLPAQGLGRIFVLGGGIRLEPMLGRVGRLFVDGHVSYAYTGDLNRLAVDAGVGFELQAGDYVGLGPYARYTQVFASGPTDGSDAMMISYGLSLSIGPSNRPAPVDSDGDGVFDDTDRCIDVPAGQHPDPTRVGCPMPDTDGDGIHDDGDVCPREPQGQTPDPQRVGCPLLDTDHDGIVDRDDSCPREPQGERPDASRPGCPQTDSDADGVYDSDDACPTTPVGADADPTRPGCPDGDDDGDGFLNARDECRTEHAGLHPDANRAGCPMADGDHDMIPDASDACPTQPGAPSSNPRRNGCPGLIVLHADSISIERPVFFATGRDTILHRSTPVLTALAEALRLTPEIHHLVIEGHTDDVGTEEDNLELSRRRAASVMAWLVDHGVEASRLDARGMGEGSPTAEGTSEGAREENRSVEFRIVDPAAMSDEGASR